MEPTSHLESSHFDGDFENVSHREAEDFVSSTTYAEHQSHEASSEEREAEPLISFGDEQPPAKASPAKEPERQPVSAPATAPACTTPTVGLCEGCQLLQNLDPRFVDLVQWRDVKKTAVVFAGNLFLLLSVAMFSVVSVVANLALVVLTITFCFRIYKWVVEKVQKSGEGNPFKAYLDKDLTLPEDTVHHMAEMTVKHSTKLFTNIRRLILVEDFICSLKFFLLLWILTYIGSWFNGMTLVILADVGLFTMPKVYQTYKVQIDEQVNKLCSKVKEVHQLVEEKLPFLKKKQA